MNRIAGMVIACLAVGGLTRDGGAWASVLDCTEESLAEVLRQTDDEYGEVPAYQARSDDGFPIVVTVSPQGSWSLMVVCPDGTVTHWISGNGWTKTDRDTFLKPKDRL